MSTAEDRIKELALEIPSLAPPLYSYIPYVRTGNLLFVSGQVPRTGDSILHPGKLGREVNIEQGQAAARVCILNALSVFRAALGSLNRVSRIVKVVGFVASAEGFTQAPVIINAASELLVKIFGEDGRHARSAVGVAELPLGCCVEIELIAEIKDEVKLEVQLKRNMMQRKIKDLRKRAKRRKAALETQLNKIKSKMAKDIMDANREGDMQLCRRGQKNAGKKDAYCDTNFIADYIKNYDCKDKAQFCYMCCENEFGNNFIDKRDSCYDMCDGKMSAKKAKKMAKKAAAAAGVVKKKVPKKLGGWVWRKDVKKQKKRTPKTA